MAELAEIAKVRIRPMLAAGARARLCVGASVSVVCVVQCGVCAVCLGCAIVW